MKSKHFTLGTLALACLLCGPAASATDSSDAMNQQAKMNQNAQLSQKKVDQYSEKTQQMFAQYKSTLRQLESMRVYNNQIARMIDKQTQELVSLERQITQIDQTAMDVTPLMLDMVDALEQFIALDIPFQTKERRNRVQELAALMDSPDVTTSEKYRKVMEAYQIENSFSTTIESYKDSLTLDGKTMTYNFLRVGRLALLYQSPDGADTGMWNQKTHTWQPLDESYRTSVQEGIRIAKKQAPPALIKLPVFTGEASL